ncbi:MAG: hypothetical protein ACRDQA_32195 [Nocardioidaceae bacterium]
MTETLDTNPECWFCNDDLRDPPAGGWLYEDAWWRVGHVPAEYAVAGTVIIESRRHVPDQSLMTPDEERTLVPLTGRVLAAVTSVTQCDRVYQWATMDAYPHFHLWLLPWWASGPLRGPRYLADALVDSSGASAEEATEAAARLMALLTDDSIRPTESGVQAAGSIGRIH